MVIYPASAMPNTKVTLDNTDLSIYTALGNSLPVFDIE